MTPTAFLLTFVLVGASQACTSARSRIPTLSNVVDNFPAMFTFVADPAGSGVASNGRLAAKYCPKKPHLTCSIVRMEWKALKALKVKFPLKAGDPSSYLVLKKVTEEGLDLVLAEIAGNKTKKARATADITFKNGSRQSAFVVKRGKIFGSVEDEDLGTIYLKPCPGDAQDC